jgi:hypothetical protein
MWTKEPELAQPQAPAGFDLDMDILDQPPPQPRMPSFAGPFGGLRSRNKDHLNYSPSEDYIVDEEKLPREIWVDPSSELMMEAQIVEEEVFEPESQPEVEIETEIPILEQLVAALNIPEGMGLAELLSAMRRPVIGTKQSNPLDLMTLRNLSHNDATLVEVASQRSFSPSDARLQDSLGVKRPRMSQMCNRLYRAGILTVQQKGRSRYFVLTNDAKAQLIAWGMMEDSQ